jgi:hypothetical protein
MKPDYRILIRPAFILSLVLLVVNDLWLKQSLGNWFTGKLSDFFGMFAFGTFLVACFPFHRISALIFAALFFTWWKSPVAEPFILFCNDSLGLPVGRVIDYTDLIALSVLPFCRFKSPLSSPHAGRWAGKLLAITAFIAFCSTSMPYRPLYYYPSNHMQYHEAFYTRGTEDEIITRLKAKGLEIERGYEKFFPAREQESLYYKIKENDSIKYVKVLSGKDSTSELYVRNTWSQGFYLVKKYPYGPDTLYNLTFSIGQSGKKKFPTSISVVSFEPNHRLRMQLYKSKYKRRLKQHFGELFQAN